MLDLKQCPICMSEAVVDEFESPTTRNPADGYRWHIWKCSACGHRFMNPQPTARELERFYNSEYAPYSPDHGAEGSDECVMQSARESGSFRHLPLPAGKRLLDVGCGAGYFLRIAKGLGAIAEGIEPSGYAAEQARHQGIEVFCGTAEEYAQKSNGAKRFDIITLNHVLEHLLDPVATLATLKTLLNSEGIIWIAVPNGASWSFRRLRDHWHSLDVPYHVQHFSPSSLQHCGAKAGLKPRRLYTYCLPSALAASIRMNLRRHYHVPRKVSSHLGLIDSMVAPWLARRLDKDQEGEAIICEFE